MIYGAERTTARVEVGAGRQDSHPTASKLKGAAGPKRRDEVVFHGNHRNLFRALVAERTLSPLTQRTMYRVVDFASEMFDPEPGRWLDHDQVYMIHAALR